MVDASPSSSEVSTSGNVSYIDHTVSRLDTLPGVAIKYGVEVWLNLQEQNGGVVLLKGRGCICRRHGCFLFSVFLGRGLNKHF
jgi:hypothetical protein